MKSTFALLIALTCIFARSTAELTVDQPNHPSSGSFSSTLFEIGAIVFYILFGVILPLFIYTFVVKPYISIQHYRKQGIPMFYAPVIGSFSHDLENAREKGDYYHDWIQIAKQEPRPKAMGKNVGQSPQLYIIDPEATRQFFLNHESYIKHPFLNALTKILSKNGLVMAEGNIWRKHRKLMSPGFQFDMLKGVIPDVLKHSMDLLEGFKNKDMNGLKIFDEFRDSAGEVIGRIFFEESLGQYTMQGIPMTLFLSNILSRVTSEAYEPLYLMFGLHLAKTKIIPRHKKLINDIMEFRSWCKGIVQRNMAKRREDFKKGLYPYEKRKTMFDLFFDHELANPTEALTEEELIDEYITVFSDGVYTTGHFISMCSFYLEKNPEWKQKVIEEMDTLFPSLSDIDYDSIQKMDVLAACMKETHRLAPPVVTAIERIALFDHDLAGIQVKKGTILMACHAANHLDERYFEDPYTYNPERWIKPSKSQESVKDNPSLFIPFSMGPRKCIGQNFAMNEAKIFLTIFMRKYRYELADKSYQLKFTQRFLREPLDPIVYKLTPREGAN